MKLSRLERQLLKHIDAVYPFIWTEDESIQFLTHEERPLVTREDLIKHFNSIERSAMGNALDRLRSYQCIKNIRIYHKKDIIQYATVHDRYLRPSDGSGVDAYQIRHFGKETITTFIEQRLRVMLSGWLRKLADDYVPLTIAFILGLTSTACYKFIVSIMQQN